VNPTPNLFCMKQFKPVIAVIVVLSAGVVGWTILRQSTAEPSVFCNRGALMQVATAPPIKAGVPAPHPDWGACSNCHEMIGAGGGATPAATVMSIAAAPPIKAGVPAPHSNWGACSNCHEIIGAGGATKIAAVTGGAVAVTPLGFWIEPLTPATADQLGLDKAEGVIVTGVRDPSPAKNAGLQVGDVLLRVENTQIATVDDVVLALSKLDPTDRINVQIFRDGRPRRLFIDRAASAPSQGAAPLTPAAIAQPARTRVAVAATGANLGAQVATVFGGAPYFVVYDPAAGTYSAIQNAGAGTLTAGEQATELLIGAGVGAVIAGDIGPASTQRLLAAGIRVYTGVFGPVRQVLDQYGRGKLVAVTGAGGRPLPFQPPVAQNAPGGKIAIAADGPTLASRIAADLGAAPYLIIYDFGTGEVEALAKDPDVGQGTGAVETAQLIVDRGASAVIAGNITAFSVQTLSSLGVVSFSGVVGSAEQATRLYQAGRLQAMTVTAGGGNTRAAMPVASSGMTL